MNLSTHRPSAARARLPGGTRIAVGWDVMSGGLPGDQASIQAGTQLQAANRLGPKSPACYLAPQLRREAADFAAEPAPAKESDR